MLNNCNRCISLFASRMMHDFNINISTRLRYSTLIQKHNTLNDAVSVDNIYNKHLSEWSINDVSIWLSNIDNGVYFNYIDCFTKQKIDGLTLQYLSENDLNDLGVKIMGDRKHIIHSLNDLFKHYNINISIDGSGSHQSLINDNKTDDTENIAINIGIDTANTADTDNIDIIPITDQLPANIDIDDRQSHKLQLFHPDYTLPMIQLPQFKNVMSNISDNILRIEYECPWSIERFNEEFNRSISELCLSSPAMSLPFTSLSTFNCDIDDTNNQLILHGNFIELSGFIKDVYQLNDCPTLPILPRISHFLMDCGELPRIAKLFNVIPFIRNDGKLSFYSSTAAIYNATKAIDAVKSLLKTLDCSAFYGARNTAIIGSLLSMESTKTLFTTNLSRYGYIQYWNRGYSIFETEYRFSRNIQKNNIYHLLLIKPFSPSNLNEMHQIIKGLLSQNSTWRNADIGLVWFILYRIGNIMELQKKYGVFIGACSHSKTVYVCGGTEKLRQDVLNEIFEKQIYSNLSHCKLSDDFQEYIFNCDSLSHFKPLKGLHSKQMQAHFVYNDEDNKTYLVTPSIYKSDCIDFINNTLEPSLLKLKTNRDSMILHEYTTLMSKLSDQKVFLTAHIAMDEKKENLYVFHKKLADDEYKKFIKKEIIRYQNMKHHAIDVSNIYSWIRKHLHRILKYTLHWDSNTTLITLLAEDKSLNIRCNHRIYAKLNGNLNKIMKRIFAIPIYERLHWITHYEMNNNVNILNDTEFWFCWEYGNGGGGMYYLYNRDYYKTIVWINKYLDILIQIGLTYNQFPNDEHILQRDCEFLLQFLPKFNLLPDKSLLFANESIVNFTLLIIYECVLSTRYDLCISLWRTINELEIKDNILIPNFLNIVFVESGKEFSQSDMRAFLLETKILFKSEMIEFIMKTLKENKKKKEMELIRDVLEDIHLDNDISWSFKDLNWNI